MRLGPSLLFLAACTSEVVPPTPDAAPDPVSPTVVYLTPTQHLTRASMALRGVRPSLEDLRAVEADPQALGGIVDRYLGFDNRVVGMYVHQMPPASHTETHKHDEAIVYVLSGRGRSIVEGETFEWRAGDTIFVKPGQWHQHFNTDPDHVSQHIALYTQPLKEHVSEGAELVEVMPEDDYEPPPFDGRVERWWE